MLRLLKPSTFAQKRTLTTMSARVVACVRCDLFIAHFERHPPWVRPCFLLVGRSLRLGLLAFVCEALSHTRRL